GRRRTDHLVGCHTARRAAEHGLDVTGTNHAPRLIDAAEILAEVEPFVIPIHKTCTDLVALERAERPAEIDVRTTHRCDPATLEYRAQHPEADQKVDPRQIHHGKVASVGHVPEQVQVARQHAPPCDALAQRVYAPPKV